MEPDNSPQGPGVQQLELSTEEIVRVQTRFLMQVYSWMAAALGLTGGIAMFVAASEAMQQIIFGVPFLFLGLLLTQLVVVGFLSRKALDWSQSLTTAAFIGYAVLNGLTFGIIFLAYTRDSVASTFFVTGGTFALMSGYGFVTGTDLSRWGNLLFMGLIGIVIATVVNMFWLNSLLYTITSYIGVLLFVGLTAYDTQKMKALAFVGFGDEEVNNKASILGALILYLDFINLFLFLLRIFGRRR